MSPLTGKFQSLHPLGVGALVAGLAATCSYALPSDWAASGIGGLFLGATYALSLGGNRPAGPFGLSLGGLLDPAPLSFGRLFKAAGGAAVRSAVALALIAPAYAWAFRLWFGVTQPFDLALGLSLDERGIPSPEFLDLALGHLFVIALPEEAFFRGYLQTALERRWPPRHRLLGVPFGAAILVSSAIFALGHLASLPQPSRLAVFFPSLLFAWQRRQTGGIGTSVVTHAACNLLVLILFRGYGLN